MERVNGFLTDFWQCEEAEDDKVRVTVALKGGFVKSLYQNKDTKEILEINPAAGGIFLQILRHRIWQKGIECAECKAGKNGIYISMALSEEKQKEQLEDVFKAIFEHPVTETEFEAGKQQSITALRQKFKDEMARSWYYMFEFTEIGKQYTYNKLAKALETSSYEEFYTYKEALVTPRNSIVMINGMLELKEVTGACYILKSVAEQGTEYVDYGYFLQEEGILDCHLMKNMSCSSMGAMYFAFPDSNVTLRRKCFC